MKIAVLGDGGWGTALALLLKNKGFTVSIWGVFRDNIIALQKHRENKKFLPDVELPEDIEFTCDIHAACEKAHFIILAIPSRFFRQVLAKHKDVLKKTEASFVSVTKGLEQNTLMRMSQVVFDVLGGRRLAVLSGPSIAPEVARGIPTAVVIASQREHLAIELRDVFRTDRFRVYTNRDVVGVEFGGSLKNIIAIAAGISDGLGFGANTKAGILTRGLIEITRLGTALGASESTFNGLSGLGDLITTSVSPEGRNRSFGEKIGKGKKPGDILKNSIMEIEGAWTSKAAFLLGKRHNIELPITQEVYSVLFENKSPLSAVSELMMREPKDE